MTAYAYLRRSRVDARRPGTVSYEQQLEAVRALAAKHGDADPVVIEDWGKSGRAEKQHLRVGFAELTDAVERGEVTAVYAYELFRLGRSLEATYRFVRLCADKGVPIRCADGYSPDVTTAIGRMVTNILLSIGAYYAEQKSEQMAEIAEARRAKGLPIGKQPYGSNGDEDVDRIVEAYREAGSFGGAVRLLRAWGVPTRTGRPWAPSSVRHIIQRQRPDVMPRKIARGRHPERAYLLSGLLVCPFDGATLTGRTEHKRRSGRVDYECKRSHLEGHGKSSISEARILPLVKAEAARLRPPKVRIGGKGIDLSAKREELAAKRIGIGDAYADGAYGAVGATESRAAMRERLAAIDRALDELDEQERATRARVIQVPAIRWEGERPAGPTPAVNAALRSVWSRIDLDDDLLPKVDGVHWLVPEWRAD